MGNTTINKEKINNTEQVSIYFNKPLEYIQNYGGEGYYADNNPKYNGLTEKEKEKNEKIKNDGQIAVKEMEKIAKYCLLNNTYLNYYIKPIKWLTATNPCTAKNSLWVQMKNENYEESPISISIFAENAEKKDNTNDLSNTRYRVCLEVYEKNLSDDAKKNIYDKFHKHLDKNLKEGLEYFIVYKNEDKGENKDENIGRTNDKTQAKNALKNNTVERVQIGKRIDYKSNKTEGAFKKEISGAVNALTEYYKYVMKENDSELNKNEQKNIYDKNIILYGPPGTGKTYESAIYAVAICNNTTVEDISSKDYSETMERYNKLKNENRIAFTTFHQSYGYEEFIEGIKPVTGDSGNIEYSIEGGVFKRFCEKARANENKNFVFIIDEINRGNISKIFGELITLIEDTKRGGTKEAVSAILPYSNKPFSVPQNVYIIGTMNTADRSISLMDTALRRRFQFVEMLPNTEILSKINAGNIEENGKKLDVIKMLEKINERIVLLYDREHTIGHAFFTKLADNKSIETLASIFKKSVIPLLQEYFYEDYQKIQLVLGDNKKENEYKFIKDDDVKINDVFGEGVEDIIDLPEKKYSINNDAFKEIDAYIKIYE